MHLHELFFRASLPDMTEPTTPNPAVTELAERALDAGVNMSRVLEAAGVNPSTWWRWRQGKKPIASTLAQVRQALDAEIEARA
jgi:post-segregation antitoxin (ccd killing protein)